MLYEAREYKNMTKISFEHQVLLHVFCPHFPFIRMPHLLSHQGRAGGGWKGGKRAG